MNIQSIQEILQDRLSGIQSSETGSIKLIPIGGGSINETYQVKTNKESKFFLKVNSSKNLPALFEKEMNGLVYLARQNCILTPEIILYETNIDHQMLLLEWIEPGPPHQLFWKIYGEQLAALHSMTNDSFGFMEDNYIGALPQSNTFTADWTEFFIHSRLKPQISLAASKGLLGGTTIHAFEVLFKQLGSIFNTEPPSLLHGDLWSGNFICNKKGHPVLIDPAVYFGHRSMDLGMSTLFGGFDKAFYESYHYHSSLPPNYREQWELCNLYPLLIHLNLFGGSYLSGITRTLKKFAE